MWNGYELQEKLIRHLQKNKYDCPTWNTKGIIDVKKQIWLTKILEAVNLTFMGLVFCIYKTVYIISKDIGINKEREICLPSNESISGHRCERTTVAPKCGMLMNAVKMS